MRLLWLPDVLRGAGLTVFEYAGWRGRGAASFGPVEGIICHGTAGALNSRIEDELRTIAITGSKTARPPISQLVLARSGDWWVVASGTCTGVKTGTAGPLRGRSDDAVLQIEAQHHPSEPWTDGQYRSYVRGVAALVAHRVPGYDVTVDRVAGHYEHQPREKTDPWFDMSRFRRDVAVLLDGGESMGYGTVVKGTKGQAARFVQQACRDVDPASLPKYGIDDDYGGETAQWVARLFGGDGQQFAADQYKALRDKLREADRRQAVAEALAQIGEFVLPDRLTVAGTLEVRRAG